MLGICFDLQETYGKKPQDIIRIGKSFAWALSKYPIGRIECAFGHHMETSKRFPTLSCIMDLLENRTPKPKLSGVYYQALMKRLALNDSFTDAESRFMNAFEDQQDEYCKDIRLLDTPPERGAISGENAPKHIGEILSIGGDDV